MPIVKPEQSGHTSIEQSIVNYHLYIYYIQSVFYLLYKNRHFHHPNKRGLYLYNYIISNCIIEKVKL